jgi:hypothetical protein
MNTVRLSGLSWRTGKTFRFLPYHWISAGGVRKGSGGGGGSWNAWNATTNHIKLGFCVWWQVPAVMGILYIFIASVAFVWCRHSTVTTASSQLTDVLVRGSCDEHPVLQYRSVRLFVCIQWLHIFLIGHYTSINQTLMTTTGHHWIIASFKYMTSFLRSQLCTCF